MLSYVDTQQSWCHDMHAFFDKSNEDLQNAKNLATTVKQTLAEQRKQNVQVLNEVT